MKEIPKKIDKLLKSSNFDDKILGMHLLKLKFPDDWEVVFLKNDIILPNSKYTYPYIYINPKTVTFKSPSMSHPIIINSEDL